MKVIALVGESGTGKTTIARHLEARGAGRVDADALAHELLASDGAVRGRIRARFGDGVFVGGDVDRQKLGAIVFRDAEALEALNAIIHPPVIEACRRRIDGFEAQGYALAVIDAALLLDVGAPIRIDLTIALKCDRDEQVRRLAAEGRSLEDIEARLRSQAHLKKSFYKADVVVDTGGEKSAVLAEIDRIVEPLIGGG